MKNLILIILVTFISFSAFSQQTVLKIEGLSIVEKKESFTVYENEKVLSNVFWGTTKISKNESFTRSKENALKEAEAFCKRRLKNIKIDIE